MNQLNLLELGAKLGMFYVPFLFALCFHEFAHGLVARWRGDNTAQMMGRLTLNPFSHADPIGTFALPILAIVFSAPIFFGWAKPVPVNERNLRRPRQDMFWIALAGPASNVLLALVAMVLMGVALANGLGKTYLIILDMFMKVNLFLAIFNMIPIHPLDGGKVIAPFLPLKVNMWLEENQGALNMFLLFFILFVGSILAAPVYFLSGLLHQGAIALAGML